MEIEIEKVYEVKKEVVVFCIYYERLNLPVTISHLTFSLCPREKRAA